MKIRMLLFTLGTLLIGHSNVSAELPVYPNSIWKEEPALRKAIMETYPGLVTRCYHFNTHTMVGILADEENKRVLFLLYPEGTGMLTIEHNGTMLNPKKLSPALLKTKDKQDRIEYLDIGLWIPMSKKDTLKITANMTYSAEFNFSIKYDPDRDWRSSVTEIKVDESRLKKADAYHFSEDSLLEDVRTVLKKQPTCRVKLKHNQIVTVKPWKLDEDAILMPMVVKVGDKISINDGAAEEFVADRFELRSRLDGYVAVARAGAQVPRIRLRVTPKASDECFRATLLTIREKHIMTIQLEEVPK